MFFKPIESTAKRLQHVPILQFVQRSRQFFNQMHESDYDCVQKIPDPEWQYFRVGLEADEKENYGKRFLANIVRLIEM